MTFLIKGIPFWALTVFLFISLYSSYSDIRYRKIKNWLLVSGAGVGVCLQLLAFEPDRFLAFFITFSTATAIALILWQFNVWAAGDAKFFIFTSIFVCLLYPPSFFKNTAFEKTIIIIVLGNAFIAAFLFIFLEATVSFFREACVNMKRAGFIKALSSLLTNFKDSKARGARLRLLFFYLATILIISAISRSVQTTIFSRIPYYLFYLLLALLYSLTRRFIVKIKLFYLVPLVLFVIFFLRLNLLQILKSVMAFLIFFGLIRFFIGRFVQKEIRIIAPEEIKPNILLTEEEIASLPPEEKTRLKFFPDGLTPEQARHLGQYFKSNNTSGIRIYNTFPFIPFIVIGVIVTYFLHGRLANIFSFLY